MVADQPLVLYPKDDKKEREREITRADADKIYERWKEKRRRNGPPIGKGEKIRLSNYEKNEFSQNKQKN